MYNLLNLRDMMNIGSCFDTIHKLQILPLYFTSTLKFSRASSSHSSGRGRIQHKINCIHTLLYSFKEVLIWLTGQLPIKVLHLHYQWTIVLYRSAIQVSFFRIICYTLTKIGQAYNYGLVLNMTRWSQFTSLLRLDMLNNNRKLTVPVMCMSTQRWQVTTTSMHPNMVTDNYCTNLAIGNNHHWRFIC